MCALQIFAKATAAALLAVTNSAWLWYYFLGDHGFHVLYRAVRRDSILYIPMPAVATYPVSMAWAVMSKVCLDFTGSPHFRLPLINGGSYYAFSLASSQASVLVAVYLYTRYATPPSGAAKLAEDLLWTGASALTSAWLCTVLFFVFRIAVPKYRHTLWSPTSGRKCAHDYFLKGKSDEDRFNIFRRNLLLWESDIGEEVKAWTVENWARWKEEKPDWFKPEMVPDRFIPAAELEQLGFNRKRRGSAAESIRESFREAGGGEE
jgi:hypothetical protein